MSLNFRIKRKYFALYIGCCTGIIFGMGLIAESQGTLTDIIKGIILGILAGYLIFKFADVFLNWKIIDEAPPLPLPDDETLLKVIAANRRLYFPNAGWLYLTNKKLYFRINKKLYFPHKWKKFEKKEITIPLEDVIDVKLFSMGIFQIGIKIKKGTGKNENFRIENEEEWRDSILDIISKNKMEVSS